jgi:hypothetical protein
MDLSWDVSTDNGGEGLLDMRERRKWGERFTEIARVGSNTTSKKDRGWMKRRKSCRA